MLNMENLEIISSATQGVKNNVEHGEFRNYIKCNTELRKIINSLLFKGTSLKRRIQSAVVFVMIRI